MNKDIAEFPNPCPFDSKSSSINTITPAKVNYNTINIAFPLPTFSMSPYIPLHT